MMRDHDENGRGETWVVRRSTKCKRGVYEQWTQDIRLDSWLEIAKVHDGAVLRWRGTAI